MKANSGKCDFICSTNNKVNVIIKNLKKQKKTNSPCKKLSLREKCPNEELFLVIFSCFRADYGNLLSECRKIWARNNSLFGRFSRSVTLLDLT